MQPERTSSRDARCSAARRRASRSRGQWRTPAPSTTRALPPNSPSALPLPSSRYCRSLLRPNRNLDAPVLRHVLAAIVGGDRPRCAEPDRLELTWIHARAHQIGYHRLGAPERELLIGI